MRCPAAPRSCSTSGVFSLVRPGQTGTFDMLALNFQVANADPQLTAARPLASYSNLANPGSG